jgi:hypothetical protein
MAAAKHLFTLSTTAANIYAVVRRLSDSYLLDDADGVFKTGTPADPYISLTENAVEKGVYEVSETRTVWTDGRYRVTFYKRVGGAPAPVTDAPPIGVLEYAVSGDALVFEQTQNNTLLYLRGAMLGLNKQVTAQGASIAAIQLQLKALNSNFASLDKAQRRGT